MSLELFLWILTIIVVVLALANHWNLSKGRLYLTYPMSIVILSIYMTIETIIAVRDSVQYSMLLFNLVNGWGIIMAIRGMIRLKNEKEKNNK